MVRIDIPRLCEDCSLLLVTFPIQSEYSALDEILLGCDGQKTVLIHSKPVRTRESKGVTLVDATGHSLTPREEILRRIDSADSLAVDDPSNLQDFLGHLRRLKRSLPETAYWIWWSPSDLVAQGVPDSEIARCLRVIAKEFSKSHFIALVAEQVHSSQGQALLEYVSEGIINAGRDWSIAKHPVLSQDVVLDVA